MNACIGIAQKKNHNWSSFTFLGLLSWLFDPKVKESLSRCADPPFPSTVLDTSLLLNSGNPNSPLISTSSCSKWNDSLFSVKLGAVASWFAVNLLEPVVMLFFSWIEKVGTWSDMTSKWPLSVPSWSEILLILWSSTDLIASGFSDDRNFFPDPWKPHMLIKSSDNRTRLATD